MEDKFLIKSEPYIIKNPIKCIAIICALLALIIFFCVSIGSNSNASEYEQYVEHHKYYSSSWEGHWEHTDALCHYGGCEGHKRNESRFRYNIVAFLRNMDITSVLLCLTPLLAVLLLAIIVNFWLRSYELVVSDKRIYGRATFGKRVDLPIDSVSAIGTKWPKGIAVATSSGKISFLMIKNHDKIHKCISNLLIEHQKKSTVTLAAPVSNADELKKFKELLDEGVITQAEFDAKKKQLLGL